MRRVGIKLKLDNQTYSYTTLKDVDAAVANTRAVIQQRQRRNERDEEVVRRLLAGREDLAKQIRERDRQQSARKREKQNAG